ncbi:MAG: DUF4054 domain-containing protein [Zoogloeaceae bacterium]|jgi:hypothetical protein|nr:DUF4054 domain-containing protein [Zoogloeaceae bacterium]
MLSVAVFRAMFPEFADPEKYPDATIEANLARSREWLAIPGDCAEPYYLLSAHFLAQTGAVAAREAQFGVVTSASVGAVSVSVQAPAATRAWQAYLSGTPYGQQLWAWLTLKSAGGWSLGGLPEREAYRKVGGVFW